MILGSNTGNHGSMPQSNSRENNFSNFNERLQMVKKNEERRMENLNKQPNSFTSNDSLMKKYNVTNQNDMREKSIAMLEDRLHKGLISLDEFSKKANQINKIR